MISVDGLGAVYLQGPMNLGRYPNLAALRRLGSSTLNARSDCDYTVTLPNHTSMLTGRPVAPDEHLPPNAYHGWVWDSLLGPDDTLHNTGNPNLSYIASIFDVAHDYRKKTCLYAGKSKFSLFSTSYDANHGAIDHVGVNNGRNKIDHVVIIDYDSDALVSIAESDFTDGICDVIFFHIAEPDLWGHSIGWGTPEWLSDLERVDAWIGRLAKVVTANPVQSQWGLVLTADHGGNGESHSDSSDPWDYTIPFIAIGPGFTPNSDLYTLVNGTRRDPGNLQLRYFVPGQPIRNGDVANVALGMLGLPPVPGSLMRGLLVAQ